MDGRSLSEAFGNAFRAMFVIGVLCGVVGGLIGFGLVGWLVRHISLAWH
jgi:uncharacterized protein (DUF2062 family)